jgi:hypothetical protein
MEANFSDPEVLKALEMEETEDDDMIVDNRGENTPMTDGAGNPLDVDFRTFEQLCNGITMQEHMVEVGRELAKVINKICFRRTHGLYGECSVKLPPLFYDNVNEHYIIFFRCYSGKVKNPCLARFHDKFKPHSQNLNYVVLNLTSQKWFMCCHNYNCVRNYLLSQFKVDASHRSNKEIADLKVKARSEHYQIDSSTPRLFLFTTALCNRILKYETVKKRLETEKKKKQIKARAVEAMEINANQKPTHLESVDPMRESSSLEKPSRLTSLIYSMSSWTF